MLVGLLLLAAPRAEGGISGVASVAWADGSPLVATHAPGDPHHLYVALRDGRVNVLDLRNNQWAAQPLVTVPGVDTLLEGGLLGLAFHPDFATNGKFYVHATLDPGDANPGFSDPFVSTVLEYAVSAADPLIADPTPRTVLAVPQPFPNHNGGWIGFNPAATGGERSHLYVTLGDGGWEPGTSENPGQDTTGNLLASVLRVDPDGDDFPADPDRNYAIPASNPFVGQAGEDEVFAYGLRNPYRASFDRATGDLWIGDVGEGDREEVDVIRSGSPGGENFGWDACEGLAGGAACDALGPGVVDPVYDYSHPGQPYSATEFQGRSITGGVVYRGPDPELNGRYLFGDIFSDLHAGGEAFWSLDAADPVGSVERIEDELFPGGVNTIGGPAAFGEDAAGNVYILTLGGGVYRIETDALLAGDFNADGRVDAADYTAWRDGPTPLPTDLALWRANYGRTAADPPAAATATPEPHSVLGLLSAVVIAGSVRRHTDRRPAPR